MARRTLGNAGLFGPWLVDSSQGAAPATDSVRLTQLALEALVSDEVADDYPIPSPDGGGTGPEGVNPDAGVSICGAEVPLAWWEIETTDTSPPDVSRYAKVPINIGSPIEPRATSLGTIRRALSNEIGEALGSSVSPVFADTDRVLRGLEDTDSLVNRRAAAYVSSEAAMRLYESTGDPIYRPRRVFNGRITDAEPLSRLAFRMQIKNYLAVLLDKFQERVYPTRVFNLTDFPNMGNPESDEASPGNPTMVGQPVPVGYGLLSDESAVTPAGVVPGIYAGKTTLPGYDTFLFDRYVFYGHAPANVPWALFIPEGPGLSVGTDFPSRIRITADSGYAEYIFPGTPQWTYAFGGGAPPYRDINGRRYTECYAFGPRSDLNRTGRVPLVANIPGIESNGNSTGTLITGLFEQILHALVNWFLPDTPYQSGDWLSVPSVGDGAELYSLIDTDSFRAAQAFSAQVMGGNVEGFQGAWLMGGLAPTYSLAGWLSTAARNGGFRYGENADGQLIASMLNPNAPLVRAVVDVTDTIAQSFQARRRRDQIKNVVTSRYQRRYVPPFARATPAEDELLPRENVEQSPDWAVDNQRLPATGVISASIAKYGERYEDISFELVRDAATHAAVRQLVLDEREDGPIENIFKEGPCGTLTDLGDRIQLDHFEGVTASGYADRSMQCQAHTLNLDDWTVEQEHRDLTGRTVVT